MIPVQLLIDDEDPRCYKLIIQAGYGAETQILSQDRGPDEPPMDVCYELLDKFSKKINKTQSSNPRCKTPYRRKNKTYLEHIILLYFAKTYGIVYLRLSELTREHNSPRG